MSEAIRNAMRRAARPLDWHYPCLVWVGEYLEEATGRPFLEDWRRQDWDEASGRRMLVELARDGAGDVPVERALDGLAKRFGWVEEDSQMQGAIMVGVYRGLNQEGTPAIFDGSDRWIFGRSTGGFVTAAERPDRMWEIVHA